MREGWKEERTALLNRMRGLLPNTGSSSLARPIVSWRRSQAERRQQAPDPVRVLVLEAREQFAALQPVWPAVTRRSRRTPRTVLQPSARVNCWALARSPRVRWGDRSRRQGFQDGRSWRLARPHAAGGGQKCGTVTLE